jgi:hypothetical protein
MPPIYLARRPHYPAETWNTVDTIVFVHVEPFIRIEVPFCVVVSQAAACIVTGCFFGGHASLVMEGNIALPLISDSTSPPMTHLQMAY